MIYFGSIYDLIPDIIEVLVKVLNLIQESAVKTDIRKLKKKISDNILF